VRATELGLLSRLEHLELSGSGLEGPLLSQTRGMGRLVNLIVSYNKLSQDLRTSVKALRLASRRRTPARSAGSPP
jgi:hypothetical protein